MLTDEPTTDGPITKTRDRGSLRVVNDAEEISKRRAWLRELAERKLPHADPLPPIRDLEDIAGTWLAELTWTKRAKPNDEPLYAVGCTISNAITVFVRDPRWDGVISYDELSECIVTRRMPPWHSSDAGGATCGEWKEEDTFRAESWLERAYGLKIGDRRVLHAVAVVARSTTVHPVREYLRSLTWDGVERLSSWLSDRLGVEESVYSRAVARCFLIGGVARALAPGCKLDTMTILEGPQGIRKSTALNTLFGDWFVQIGSAIDPDRTPQLLRGKWGAEFGELASLRSTRRYEIVKDFVSRKTDTFRPPYGHITRDFPRRCVFAGSTNDDQYLTDPTGLRRWWPVKCRGHINIRKLEVERDQLWAEATRAFDAREPWHFESPEIIESARLAQDERYEGDSWEEPITDWLVSRKTVGVTTGEIFASCLDIDVGRWSHADLSRVGAVIRRLGWRPKGGGRPRRYFPPETYA